MMREKYMLHYENLQLYLRLGLKLKKYIVYQNSINRNGQNPYVEFNTKKRIEREKSGGKDGKVLCKLSNSVVYGKLEKQS